MRVDTSMGWLGWVAVAAVALMLGYGFAQRCPDGPGTQCLQDTP